MAKKHPATPDVDADDLLAVGLNMAEACWPLLCTFGFLRGVPDDHPFRAKLSRTYDYLTDEGSRILIDTPAATIKGVAIKAQAMKLYDDGGTESSYEAELLASLTADLERLGAEVPEPPKLKAVA